MTLLVVAVLLVLWNRSFRATQEAVFEEFNLRQAVLVENAANAIRAFFDEVGWHLKVTAEDDPARNLGEVDARAELAERFERLKYLGVNDMGVIEVDGTLRYSLMAPALEGSDFSWRRYFVEAKKRPDPSLVISDFIEFKGVDAGEKGVIFAVPVVRKVVDGDGWKSGFGGVIVSTLKVCTVVRRFIEPLRLSDNGFVMLVDDELNILWSPDAGTTGSKLTDVSGGPGGTTSLAAALGRGGRGMGRAHLLALDNKSRIFGKDAEPYLFAYTTVRIGDGWWAIVLSTPTDEVKALLGNYYSDQMALLGVILAVTFASSSCALYLSSSQRRRLEKEVESRVSDLKESHERLIAILDGLDAAVYVSDMKTYRILFVNRYIRNIYGDVEGKLCWRVFHGDQKGPCSHCSNERLVAPDGTPCGVYKWEYRSPVDGRWYAVYDRAIKWMDGRVVRLDIAVDITERKLLEEEKLRADKLAAVGRMAAGVAHEINNPLANASLSVQMLKEMLSVEGERPEVIRKIEGVEKNIDRAAHIASELLDFSRSRHHEVVEVDVNEVVENAIVAVGYQMEDILVAKELRPLPPVMGSPERLEQVFINILKNSVEAIPDGGAISVATRSDGGLVTVEIMDNGLGISGEDLAMVFDPFFTTKGAGKGFGLGLAISYGIVTEHGGTVEIKSEPGRGTVVSVNLPVHESTKD